jgi:hypothetical protein
MERKNLSEDDRYRMDERVGRDVERDVDDVRGMDDVVGLDEERARNRGVDDERISEDYEDLQREGNLGNERNRNKPDSSESGNRR